MDVGADVDLAEPRQPGHGGQHRRPSFGIPRLDGPVKATLVDFQADEYGGGRAVRMHAELFRATMRWLRLDDSYG